MASALPLSQNAVAKAAGVSASTVSRALSNHPGIPAETRERIQQIARSMGYRKNAVVSMLTSQLRASRLRKTESTLGYVTTMFHPRLMEVNATYFEFFVGAKERAEELGYGLDLLWRREEAMTAQRFSKILTTRGIQGLILAPRPHAMSHITLDWGKFAISAIGHGLPSPRVSLSGAWHYDLIHTALRMLKKYGYRRIGFCVSPDSDKYAGYAFSSRYSLYHLSIPMSERVPFLQGPFDATGVNRRTFKQWFSKHRPEAILCVGPRIVNWLKDAGYSIPGDVAIVDLCLADESGATAGMFEMPRVIAATAVDLVVEQLHHSTSGTSQYPKSVLFGGKWVDGDSLPRKTVVHEHESDGVDEVSH